MRDFTRDPLQAEYDVMLSVYNHLNDLLDSSQDPLEGAPPSEDAHEAENISPPISDPAADPASVSPRTPDISPEPQSFASTSSDDSGSTSDDDPTNYPCGSSRAASVAVSRGFSVIPLASEDEFPRAVAVQEEPPVEITIDLPAEYNFVRHRNADPDEGLLRDPDDEPEPEVHLFIQQMPPQLVGMKPREIKRHLSKCKADLRTRKAYIAYLRREMKYLSPEKYSDKSAPPPWDRRYADYERILFIEGEVRELRLQATRLEDRKRVLELGAAFWRNNAAKEGFMKTEVTSCSSTASAPAKKR